MSRSGYDNLAITLYGDARDKNLLAKVYDGQTVSAERGINASGWRESGNLKIERRLDAAGNIFLTGQPSQKSITTSLKCGHAMLNPSLMQAHHCPFVRQCLRQSRTAASRPREVASIERLTGNACARRFEQEH